MMSLTEVTTCISVAPRRIERRRNPRYAFIAEVEIVELESGMTMTAHTSDFSRGGCYVDYVQPAAGGHSHKASA